MSNKKSKKSKSFINQDEEREYQNGIAWLNQVPVFIGEDFPINVQALLEE
jgi:hypothetical protein